QRVGEPRAGRAEVESPRLLRADLVLQQARRARKHHVGRRRADDEEIDVRGGETRLRDRLERGLLREVGRGNAWIDDVALADAGALLDPLVAGLDHLLEVAVRQHAWR